MVLEVCPSFPQEVDRLCWTVVSGDIQSNL